jgi:hypothetical protein
MSGLLEVVAERGDRHSPTELMTTRSAVTFRLPNETIWLLGEPNRLFHVGTKSDTVSVWSRAIKQRTEEADRGNIYPHFSGCDSSIVA